MSMREGGESIGRAAGIALAALAVGLGAGLLAAAVPIAGAGLAETPGNAILKRIHLAAPATADLRRLIRSREASLGWREKGRTATDLGLARMMLAERAGGAERATQLALALDALETGLGLAPMNPYGWTRLALVRMSHGRPASDVAPALSLAVHAGPREAGLRMSVIQAGLYAWSALEPGDRALVGERVRQAWRTDALGTAAAAAGVERTALLARLVGLVGSGSSRTRHRAADSYAH